MISLHRKAVVHDGLSFPLFELGEGEPLLLLHGGGSRGAHFVPLMKQLASTFRGIAYDQRGFGGQVVGPEIAVDHAHWASDVIGILDALEIAQAHVLGWSLGCSVAINAAARWPSRIASLVLVGAPDPGRAVNVEALRARQALYEGLDATALQEQARFDLAAQLAPQFATETGLLDALVADRMASPPAMQARAIAGYATRPSLLAASARVQCPAFLVTGEHDRISPPGDAARMARALSAGPPSVLPDCGHYLTVERPEALARAVREAALPTLSIRTSKTETDR